MLSSLRPWQDGLTRVVIRDETSPNSLIEPKALSHVRKWVLTLRQLENMGMHISMDIESK